jgi:hypothetical protein
VLENYSQVVAPAQARRLFIFLLENLDRVELQKTDRSKAQNFLAAPAE